MDLNNLQQLAAHTEIGLNDPFIQALLIGVGLFAFSVGYFLTGFHDWTNSRSQAFAHDSQIVAENPQRKRSARTERLTNGLQGMKHLVGHRR